MKTTTKVMMMKMMIKMSPSLLLEEQVNMLLHRNLQMETIKHIQRWS